MAPLSEEMAGGMAHQNAPFLGNTSPTVPTMPLRRAVYVRVADLVRSFDIDADKLRTEMAKLDDADHDDISPEQAKSSADQDGEDPAVNVSTNEKDEREIEEDVATVAERSLAGMSLGDATKLPPGEAQCPQKSFQQRLLPPSGGYNLCLLVGKVNVVVDKLRVDRSRVRLAEVEVGDETGTVSLRARDDQIDALEEISKRSGAVVLRNCIMELYQGKHLRLAVTKWGKLSSYPDQVASTPQPPLQINKELKYSAVDLNLVVGEVKSRSLEDSSSISSGRNRIAPASVEGQSRDVGLDEVSRAPGGTPRQRRRGRDRKQQFRQGAQGMPGHGPAYLPHPGMVPGVGSFPPVYPPGTSVADIGPYGYHVPPHLRDHAGEGQRHHQHHGISHQHRDHHQKQQHLLLQQYELQQRHLEQMQLFQQQQERQRRMFESHGQQLSHHPSSPAAFMPNILRAGSIESSSSQVMMPGMGSAAGSAGVRDYHHSSSQHATVPLHQRGSSRGESYTASDYRIGHHGSRVPPSRGFGMSPYEEQFPQIEPSQQRRTGSHHEQQNMPHTYPRMDTPPASPGRMNPQAATFAPSHGESQAPLHLSHQQVPPSPHYPYAPYESIQAQSGPVYGTSTISHQQHVFSQGGLYSPGFYVPDMDDSAHTSSQDPSRETRYQYHAPPADASGQREFEGPSDPPAGEACNSSKGMGTARDGNSSE